jgi:hypothetical protein
MDYAFAPYLFTRLNVLSLPCPVEGAGAGEEEGEVEGEVPEL